MSSHFDTFTALSMSSRDQPGPPGTTSLHVSSVMMSSGERRLQLGLGVDLSHLKSSIWDQESDGEVVVLEEVVSGLEAVLVVFWRGSVCGDEEEGEGMRFQHMVSDCVF
jgi:hypothetical protein